MKARECSQHYLLNFQTHKGRLLHSQWSDLVEILTHQSFYVCSCMNEEEPIKNEGARASTAILQL